MKKSVSLGFAIAATGAVVLCIYAASWRLAAFLVIEERIGVIDVFRYNNLYAFTYWYVCSVCMQWYMA